MENYVEFPELNLISNDGLDRINELLPNFSFDEFVGELSSGQSLFTPDTVFDTLLKIFADEMYGALRILIVIIGIVMISALLENLGDAFGKKNSAVSAFVCLAMISGLSIKVFIEISAYAEGVCVDLSNFMMSLLPVMMTLTAGCGYTMTGVMAHPILLFMCNVFGVIFNKILIPLAVTYLAVSMADMVSETVQLGKLRELVKKVFNFLLGIIMTVFTGLLSICTFSGVALDSVGAKGAKFAVSNMVPFVGHSISDAMNAVAAASLVLKNSVGITGIAVILGLCVIPIIKIGAVILCIRISAAVCESVASKNAVQIISTVGDSLSMINAAVISTTVMMIISTGIVVGING